MRIFEGLAGLRQLPPGTVLSVGNFDGLHRGHEQLLQMAREIRDGGGASGVAVVTFEPHPLTVLRPALAPPRLTPPALKQSLLAEAGVDHLVVLAPTPDVLNLSAEEFWAILRDEVRPAHMIEGRSFNFGKGRGGTIERLRQWAAASAVKLDVLEPVTVALLTLEVVEVSSSLTRWLLSHGRVRDAAICFGRPYVLQGEVVKGHQRGRTIGVPTANVRVTEQMVPPEGVYAGRAEVDGVPYPAAVSIGTMPTFGENALQVEAHLIGFDGELYGRTFGIELLDWLREQQKYPGLDLLKAQLARDIAETRRIAGRDAARAIASVGDC
jgi:riboflavin kinase/FMN adenylyltransferase